MSRAKKSTRKAAKKAVTIGASDFERISAVEGIRFSPAMNKRAMQAKRDKLMPGEYRAAIIRRASEGLGRSSHV